MRNMRLMRKLLPTRNKPQVADPKKKESSDEAVLIIEDPKPFRVKLEQQESPFESETPPTNGASV